MNKIAKLCLATVILFAASNIFAAEVDENEIKSIDGQTIVFENYTGPHTKVDTLAEIKAIGTSLADKFDRNISGTYGNPDRYYVIHAVSNENSGKLDADIMFVGKNAGVDHIRNLRHIIASYLTKAYSYSYDDAYTLATFVTVYNAVYRGKLDYFKGKYSDLVVKNLTADKCGLSVSYKEWAGTSQIVIPLANVNGGLSTIDTSVISDKKVVDSMREEDDKGIDERKNMVDIKEREAEQAQEKAQEAQKTATQEEKKLQEEKKQLEEKKTTADDAQKKADEAKKTADEAKKTAEENPKDKEAQKAAAESQKSADEAQKKADEAKNDVEEQKKTVEEQQTKTDEAKKTAATEQAAADKKNTEAQSERTQIAQDQKEVINQSLLEEKTAIYALKLVDTKNLYSAITKVNRLTGEELKTSPVKVVRNRTMYADGSNFIAIAGETGKTAAVKLVQIDKTNLEIVKESDAVIAESSVLVQVGTNYFCVVNENGKNYLGKFNNNLELLVKSNVEVNPATPVIPSAEGYCVTDKSGKVIILNASDLTKKEQTTAGKAVETVKQAVNDR